MAINLLSDEFKPKKYIVKISKTLTNVALIALLVFIVSAAIITGVFFVVSNRLSDSQSSLENLETKIKALQETEHKIVLIKDRLEKISVSLSQASATEKVDILDDVLKLTEGYAFIDAVEFSDKKSNITIVTGGSINLTKLLANLIASGGFKKVNMVSFEFNQKIGYVVEFSLIR